MAKKVCFFPVVALQRIVPNFVRNTTAKFNSIVDVFTLKPTVAPVKAQLCPNGGIQEREAGSASPLSFHKNMLRVWKR